MAAIANEQEFIKITKNLSTGQVYEYDVMFLMSDVVNFERLPPDEFDKNNEPETRPITSIQMRYDEVICIICPYEIFKDKWLKYRRQNLYNPTNMYQ